MKDFRKLIQLARPHYKRIIIGVTMSFLASAMTGAIAWLVKPALDHVFVQKQYQYLKFIPAGLVFLYLLKGFLEFGQNYMMKSVGYKIVRDMRNNIYRTLLYFPVSYFTKESSGKILSKIINDVNILSGTISKILVTFFLETSQLVILSGVAIYRRWDLAMLILFILPFAAYASKRIGRKVKKKVMEAQKKIAEVTHRVNETVAGVKIIKIFNHEVRSRENFERENQSFYRDLMKVTRLKECTKVFIYAITGSALAVVLWYGGRLVVGGQITAGDFFSFLAAIFMIFSPVRKIGEDYSVYQEVLGAIERIETIYSIEREKSGDLHTVNFDQSIVFDNVSFAYPETTAHVLNNICIEINKGEVVALVGPSGAGKTTFVDLIPRFYDPTQGQILIDGLNIKNFDIHALRGLIAIVSQDIVLFDDTIWANIAVGSPTSSKEQIQQAARLAYAHEFIQFFAEGYDTVVGERGVRLSGGQKQRIAIARAIIKNPPILILDEATSALDTVSERLVQKALEGIMINRTTIIVAHRLSTIQNADKIIVLQNGSIIDIGTHNQLIERNQLYMNFYHALAVP
ncbi:MAG TPA: ABC transporter transmembrane domain-containing protein [Thermodesulfovibrionia bacterium]|nr:ABC transporter transmembrane domain-containing protein [Thermodesulfovibrionia bacterium]